MAAPGIFAPDNSTRMSLTSGGGAVTTTRLLSAAATTNATLLKASPGVLMSVIGYNAAAAIRYIKFYNKLTAPTVGTDVPILTFLIPASGPFSFNPGGMIPYTFSIGLGFALTTGAPDADTGALTLADIAALNITFA